MIFRSFPACRAKKSYAGMRWKGRSFLQVDFTSSTRFVHTTRKACRREYNTTDTCTDWIRRHSYCCQRFCNTITQYASLFSTLTLIFYLSHSLVHYFHLQFRLLIMPKAVQSVKWKGMIQKELLRLQKKSPKHKPSLSEMNLLMLF